MLKTPIALAVLLTASTATYAADCAKWSKERFWKRASVADVASCIDAGASPHAQGKDEMTPLHMAAELNENPAIIKVLIAAGADLGARNRWGYTPLHLAAEYNENPGMIAVLVSEATLEAATWTRVGSTPLHLAASWNLNPEVVRALLDAEANPNALDRKGNRPMDRRMKKKKRKILAAAGGTRTQKSAGSGGLGALIAAATVAGVGASSGAATEDILAGVEAVADAQQASTGGYQPAAPRAVAGTVGGGSCELPGYPSRAFDPRSLGLGWCPVDVDFQVRVMAIQAAAAQCALATGSSSSPDQITARRNEIAASCERLAALDGRFGGGGRCLCPPGYPDGPRVTPTPAAPVERETPAEAAERRQADEDQRRAAAERYEKEQIEKRSRAVLNSDCKCSQIVDRTGEYVCMDGFVGENICDINRGAGQ